jgi:hypothetical protein
MKVCGRRDEVAQGVRAGRWPQGCAAELRAHVAECAACAEEARMLSAFAGAREGAMRMAPAQSAELLWWKAQLRRRHEAMERLEFPGLAISMVTIGASVVLLMIVLAVVWKRVAWSRVLAGFSATGWNTWILVSVAAVLCGFAVVAMVVGLPEERE